MSRTSRFSILLCAASLLGAPLAAQQQPPPAAPQTPQDPRIAQPAKPIPPVSAAEDPGAEPVPTETVRPDNAPISGAQSFSLGLFGGRSFFAPSLRLSQLADSNNRGNTTTTSVWRGVTSMAGSVQLQHFSDQRVYSLSYTVGGSFAYRSSSSASGTGGVRSSHYHNFSVAMQSSWRRWTFFLTDNVQFLPESAVGGTGIPGIGGGIGGIGGGFGGGIGGGFGGLQPGFTPNQGILNGASKRVSNTVVGQAQYSLSQRLSMTFTGSYAILRFPDGGFIESNSYRFQTGVSYQLTKTDSLGVVYSVGLLRFDGSTRSTDNHSVQLAYGRRITSRMALQVKGGPQINLFNNPVAGSNSRVSTTISTGLTYSFPRASVGMSYHRGFTGGSGVLQGSSSDRVDFNFSRPLTRAWQFGASAGYGFNKSIRQLNTTGTEQRFHTVTGGANLSRTIFRNVSLRLSYRLQRQAGTLSACAPGTPNCGTTLLRHSFGLSLNWSPGSYELD